MQPVVADYTLPLLLPARDRAPGAVWVSSRARRSAISRRDEALHFLQLAAQVLRGGGLLLGVDLVKDPAMLHAAYNDAQGVTAAFNLNLLARANRELGADFDAGAVRAQRLLQRAAAAHRDAPGEPLSPALRGGRPARSSFDEGDTLHTENSYKFTIEGLRALAVQARLSARAGVDRRRAPVQRALAARAGVGTTPKEGPTQ